MANLTTLVAFPARPLALVAALLATACGGDSGGGGGPAPLDAPTAPVTITATNGAQVAAIGLQIATDGISVPFSTGTGVISAAGADAPRMLSRAALDGQRRLSRASTAFTTGDVQTEPCFVSGTVTISSSPTSVSFTYDQCSDYEGEVQNGTMSVSGIEETGDDWTGSISGFSSMDFTITGPGATLRMVGGMAFEASWTPTSSSSHLSGSYFGVSDGFTTEVLSGFSFWNTVDETTGLATSSSSFTLASSALDGVVTVSTPTPFQAYPFYAPHQGVLVVTGAGGGKVRLTVLGNDAAPSPQVLVEIDANGDGSYEPPLGLDWFELTGV